MGKRWIEIWLVFINLDFEVRFDNFARATCILYIDLAEICVCVYIYEGQSKSSRKSSADGERKIS